MFLRGGSYTFLYRDYENPAKGLFNAFDVDSLQEAIKGALSPERIRGNNRGVSSSKKQQRHWYP